MNGTRDIIPAVVLMLAAIVLVAQPAEAECLRYEPTRVELTGTIKRVTFPGPPNYQSIKEGDRPEQYWVLYLQKPICVDGDPNNDVNESEKNVKSLQLIIHDYERYRTLLGQRAIVTGGLTHAITGHHHTRVLINVRDIK